MVNNYTLNAVIHQPVVCFRNCDHIPSILCDVVIIIIILVMYYKLQYILTVFDVDLPNRKLFSLAKLST